MTREEIYQRLRRWIAENSETHDRDFTQKQADDLGHLILAAHRTGVFDGDDVFKLLYQLYLEQRAEYSLSPAAIVGDMISRWLPAKGCLVREMPEPAAFAVVADHVANQITGNENRKQRGLDLWNAGDRTWPDIAMILDGDRSMGDAVMQEIKRHAKSTNQKIRRGKQGRKTDGKRRK